MQRAMISDVHYLVPLVQEMARRKVIEYRHMLRFKDSQSVNIGYQWACQYFLVLA